MEEIQAKYFRELKKFITLPTRFGGLGDSKIFEAMIDRNTTGFKTIYRKAEALFTRLGKVVHHFKDWVTH